CASFMTISSTSSPRKSKRKTAAIANARNVPANDPRRGHQWQTAFRRPFGARDRAGANMKDMAKISFNRDAKFDLQLNQALLNERRLGEIFESQKIEKIELKSETWQWERTGNIAIEYR